MILERFASLSVAVDALAEQVATQLQAGLSERRAASLLVPGGRTPLPLFQRLSEARLDWARVTVSLTDERWVPEADPASNAALVRQGLLRAVAAQATLVPLYQPDGSPHAAAPVIWKRLQALPRPFDAVVLGMGEDGHFASLFPGNPALAQALDVRTAPGCVAMQAPAAPMERLSLNLAALLQTRRLFLLVTGVAKQQLLLEASRQDGVHLPVSALLAQRQRVPEVYWAP